MLDSFTYSALLLPGNAHYEPLMTWTELIDSEGNRLPFEDHTGSGTLWNTVHPEHWTRRHVSDWLHHCCDQYKLDSHALPFSQFHITGLELCGMTKEHFIDCAGMYGECLHFILQNLRANEISHSGSTQEKMPIVKDCDDKSLLSIEEGKKKPGHHPAKPGQQSPHLWEFVRDLLLVPGDHPGILDWEDRDLGIFRVVKSEALARVWGQKKKNDKMTYEKLSRALRHYYKTGILERVDRRLVYKFGKNAYGWQKRKL